MNKQERREIHKEFPARCNIFHRFTRSDVLTHVHFSDFLHQALSGSSLFLLAHNAGLFVVLTLLHFRKNASLFYLLFKATQGDIEVIIVFVKKYSGQGNHPLLQKIEGSLYKPLSKKANIFLPFHQKKSQYAAAVFFYKHHKFTPYSAPFWIIQTRLNCNNHARLQHSMATGA